MILNGDKALDMELDSDYDADDDNAAGNGEERPRHSFRSVLESKCYDRHIVSLIHSLIYW